MASYICSNCSSHFQDKKRIRKFCSKECVYEHMRNTKPEEHISYRGAKIVLKCDYCKTEFTRFRSNVKQTKGDRHFCSDNCYRKFTVGDKHPHWKGGRHKTTDGYIAVRVRNHPNATVRSTVLEHRIIAEKCLKRYLMPDEVVHHINKITTDNRPENLYLFDSEEEHKKHHRSGKTIKSNLPVIHK